MATNSSFSSDFKELEKRLGKAIHEVGKEVGKEIRVAYYHAIDAFYGGYDPRKYHRTLSTYDANSYKSDGDYKRTGKLSCWAGIIVDSQYMGEPYHKSHGWDPSADFIFHRTFYEGIHGFTNAEVISRKSVKSYKNQEFVWNPKASYSAFSKENNFLNGFHAYDTIGNRKKGLAPAKSYAPVHTMNSQFNKIRNSIGDRITGKFSL